MKLFYRKIGEGQPLIILHGLFGQSDNWNTLGRKFSEQGYEVYLVDLRNHGNSPHNDVWNYQVMSDDLMQLISELALSDKKVIVLGHSMGGKVAMTLAIQHPEILFKLVVVDIAPKFHPPDNDDVMKALRAIDLSSMKSRKEAEFFLTDYIAENGVRQFLLKNIQWKDEDDKGMGVLDWKFNKEVLLNGMENISRAVEANTPCMVSALFIRGQKSLYILDEDIVQIKKIFPRSSITTIEGAGHWVHADQPLAFYDAVIAYLRA